MTAGRQLKPGVYQQYKPYLEPMAPNLSKRVEWAASSHVVGTHACTLLGWLATRGLGAGCF